MTTLRPPYAEIDDVEFGGSDYVVHVRNGVYRAKNLHSLANEFTGPNLHTVFNAAVGALANADLQITGGHIHIASPDKSESPMLLKDSLVGATGITVTGDNQGSLIRADASFPTNKAMLDFRDCDRVHIQSLDLDCNSVAQVGIWQRRTESSLNPNVGGPWSANRIAFNRIRNYTGTTAGFGAGIVIGLNSADGATANTMVTGNNINGAKSTSVTGSLAANITTTNGTSVSVTDASGFPSTDTTTLGPWASHFLIKIDAEWMLCQGRSGNTLTVRRGQLGTTAATHTAGVGNITAYFGSHGFRVFLGDLQTNYNNLNNPSGKHGCGFYGDCHFVIYNSHVAADALTTWGCVYVSAGSNLTISDSYLDTIQAGSGIYIAPPSGSVANPMIRNNYFNMQGGANGGADVKGYGILLDASTGNIGDAMITGNFSKGPQPETTAGGAWLHGVNLTGQATFVSGNFVRGCAALNDGTAPDFIHSNVLDNNTTKTYTA